MHEAIAVYEGIDDRLGRIMSFASLVYAGDTSDPTRAKFYGDAQDRVTAIATDLLFFTLELNRLDDAALDRLAAEAPLSQYRPWLVDLRKDKPFQLDDRLEQLFHEKSVTGRAAWNRLFDETITALRFAVGPETLTLEPVLNRLQDPRGEVRKQAAEAHWHHAWGERAHLRAHRQHVGEGPRHRQQLAGLHRHRRQPPSVEPGRTRGRGRARRSGDRPPTRACRTVIIASRRAGSDGTNSTIGTAMPPCRTRRPGSSAGPRRGIPCSRPTATFRPRLSGLARRFFDDRWIDAGVRPGKAPGAFAHPTVPSAHPYVLLNYQGRPRDVMTLAHELGHGVHQLLAAPQGALMAPTPLTLAETASVFGEMLTFRAMVTAAPDPQARFALLAMKVEDMLNTVVRQIAFYQFERALHTERKGGELTADRIGALWMQVQRDSLGEAIRLGPGYETFWAYVPHFVHSPFYVYAYAFGDCLVNSLYGVYQNTPAGFAERYLAMLSAGGSKHYSELLAPFGLDARDPGFWGIGLSVIAGMIDELEASDLR